VKKTVEGVQQNTFNSPKVIAAILLFVTQERFRLQIRTD
jgi:hypothetical protein